MKTNLIPRRAIWLICKRAQLNSNLSYWISCNRQLVRRNRLLIECFRSRGCALWSSNHVANLHQSVCKFIYRTQPIFCIHSALCKVIVISLGAKLILRQSVCGLSILRQQWANKLNISLMTFNAIFRRGGYREFPFPFEIDWLNGFVATRLHKTNKLKYSTI